MSKILSYEEVDKKQLVDWIELCNDLFDEKKVKDNEHGALYSVFGRLGIYVKENEDRIAALEARLKEAEAVIKPFADKYQEKFISGLTDETMPLLQWSVYESDLRRAAAFLAGGGPKEI